MITIDRMHKYLSLVRRYGAVLISGACFFVKYYSSERLKVIPLCEGSASDAYGINKQKMMLLNETEFDF